MALRTIVAVPEKVLRRKARPISKFGDDLQVLVEDMIDTMVREKSMAGSHESDRNACARWLIGLVLAALAAPSARAQEPELETIVVTASRRAELLLTESSSLSAVSGPFIDDFGMRDIREVMTSVPGLGVVSNWDTKYTLRGVSTDTWEEARPATAEYVDETPITNPGSFFWVLDSPPYLIDRDRIEVLRGPQGTLFGSSSMGGTIRYLTRRPAMDAVEASAEVGSSGTNHGDNGYSASGMFNAPLREGVLALRGVAFYDQLGGYIDNLATGEDDVNDTELSGGRLALEWPPSDELTAIVRVNYHLALSIPEWALACFSALALYALWLMLRRAR